MSSTKIESTTSNNLEHERLTSLINSMGDGVIAIDEHFKVVIYNGAALNILDVNSSMAGRTIASVFSLIDQNNQKIDIKKAIRTNSIGFTSRDWRLVYPDNEIINLYVSIAPVRLGYGKSGDGGFVILFRDITREKSLEEERDEFISVVSHELRTPVAIAEGNVGNAIFLLDKNTDIQTLKESLKQTYNQIIFLAGMINDLSTLSRAERGRLNLEIESINVHELLEELIHNYQNDAEKKGLTLSSDIDRQLEILKSSKLYVREVLQNFVTNAIKYTESGSVILGGRPKDNGVEFYVQDTGIGISKSDKEKIFDKFFRSEDFRTRQNNGTGLGLYVTMKLARLLHADISVESELNKGSRFIIFIPNLS